MPYLGLSEGVGGVTWGWLTVGGDALADKLFTATLTPMPRTFYPHQLLTLFSTPTFFVATIPFLCFCTANPPQICPASAIVVHCHSAIVPECHSAGTSTESHGKLHRPTLYTTEEDTIEAHHRDSPPGLTIIETHHRNSPLRLNESPSSHFVKSSYRSDSEGSPRATHNHDHRFQIIL